MAMTRKNITDTKDVLFIDNGLSNYLSSEISTIHAKKFESELSNFIQQIEE
jgi:hypothetical protein